MVTPLTVELVFDRYLGADDTLDQLQALLERRLPTWSAGLRIWRSRSDQRPVPACGLRRMAVASATEHGPTYAAMVEKYGRPPFERVTGFEDVRGADTSVALYLSIDEWPFARKLGGEVLLRNDFTIELRRTRIEGVPVADFASALFTEACEVTAPVWGSFWGGAEYDAKVVSREEGIEAVGRDFGRFLPGFFPGNYFGPRYVDLIGRERLLSTPHVTARQVGVGIALLTGTDPRAWDTPERARVDDEAVAHLGREFFFAKIDPPHTYRAPDWPSS